MGDCAIFSALSLPFVSQFLDDHLRQLLSISLTTGLFHFLVVLRLVLGITAGRRDAANYLKLSNCGEKEDCVDSSARSPNIRPITGAQIKEGVVDKLGGHDSDEWYVAI